MATHPIKSLFGSLLGLTRPTATYTTERLFSKGGFIGPYLFLSTSEGSETIVDVAGFTGVETSSTGTAALATRGISIISSAASTTYTMAAPPGTGIRRTLFTTSTSTLTRQVTSAAPIVGGNSSTAGVGADGSVLTGSTSFTVMSFGGIGQAIELVSISTAAWVNTSLRGFTSTNTVPLSS
jgi:hypothetical protein